ncbi:PaaI family thioesterase [Rothia nasisuis]|uniref:PaaI family thioesterase n=1 Tax=Rothia nasisuis TaxID=2109647 RepID=UPI001F1ED557|nr:PaaI family thioesterase [Rothia nasisuis]
MTENSHDHYQHVLKKLGTGALSEKLGIRVHEASPEYLVATMPVEGNTQPVGLLHGGASAALAETAGSLAAFLSVADKGQAAVGVDLNITHMLPARAGTVTATCRAVKLGRTVTVHTVDITDDAGRLVATARITNNIITPPASATATGQ